jgi:hypothetical protein
MVAFAFSSLPSHNIILITDERIHFLENVRIWIGWLAGWRTKKTSLSHNILLTKRNRLITFIICWKFLFSHFRFAFSADVHLVACCFVVAKIVDL